MRKIKAILLILSIAIIGCKKNKVTPTLPYVGSILGEYECASSGCQYAAFAAIIRN